MIISAKHKPNIQEVYCGYKLKFPTLDVLIINDIEDIIIIKEIMIFTIFSIVLFIAIPPFWFDTVFIGISKRKVKRRICESSMN